MKRAVFLRSMAYLQQGNVLTRYRVNSAIRQEIFAFDRGGKVDEGEYVLNAISPSDSLRHKRKHEKAINSGMKKKRSALGKRHVPGNIRVAHFNGK